MLCNRVVRCIASAGVSEAPTRIAIGLTTSVTLQGNVTATNDLLLNGAHWLAANSPAQPLLKPMNLPDLAKAFLNSGLQELTSNAAGPVKCIAAFNDALERAEGALNRALSEAAPNWPPREVEIYEGPRKWALQCLPRVGWSVRPGPSDAAIERLRAAKLPSFGEGLEQFRIEEVDYARRGVNRLLAKVMGGRENDVAVAREGGRLLERGRIVVGMEGGLWYQPDWATIFQVSHGKGFLLLLVMNDLVCNLKLRSLNWLLWISNFFHARKK
jgi:hypothetical protein